MAWPDDTSAPQPIQLDNSPDPPEIQLKVTPIGQLTEATCWLACYQMLFDWKGKDNSTIEPTLSKAGLPVADMRQRAMAENEMPPAGTALGLQGFNSHGLRQGTDMIVHHLRVLGPIKVGWNLGSSKHAVILSGADSKRDLVQIIDPWDETSPGLVFKAWLPLALFTKRLRDIPFGNQTWP